MRRSSSEMTNEENAVRPITSLRMNSNSVDGLSQILVDEELAKVIFDVLKNFSDITFFLTLTSEMLQVYRSIS